MTDNQQQPLSRRARRAALQESLDWLDDMPEGLSDDEKAAYEEEMAAAARRERTRTANRSRRAASAPVKPIKPRPKDAPSPEQAQPVPVKQTSKPVTAAKKPSPAQKSPANNAVDKKQTSPAPTAAPAAKPASKPSSTKSTGKPAQAAAKAEQTQKSGASAQPKKTVSPSAPQKSKTVAPKPAAGAAKVSTTKEDVQPAKTAATAPEPKPASKFPIKREDIPAKVTPPKPEESVKSDAKTEEANSVSVEQALKQRQKAAEETDLPDASTAAGLDPEMLAAQSRLASLAASIAERVQAGDSDVIPDENLDDELQIDLAPLEALQGGEESDDVPVDSDAEIDTSALNRSAILPAVPSEEKPAVEAAESSEKEIEIPQKPAVRGADHPLEARYAHGLDPQLQKTGFDWGLVSTPSLVVLSVGVLALIAALILFIIR